MADAPPSRPRRIPAFVVSLALVAGAGAAGLNVAVRRTVGSVTRAADATESLSPSNGRFVNYLLVGSDSREGASESDADFAVVGDEGDVSGRRSDTLMILHHDLGSGTLSLLSVPRDLWVKIGDGEKSQRVNTAYQLGRDVLVRTVQNALGIPVHHYLEVDFRGFKTIVDAVGGVEVCVEHLSRDRNTGLYLRPGCRRLDGVRALAYARSRKFEERIGDEWVRDGTGDLGRATRQRAFVGALARSAVSGIADNPFRAGLAASEGLSALVTDEELNLVAMVRSLAPSMAGGVGSFSLPVVFDRVGEASVLRLGEGSDAVLAFFAGEGPAPAQDGEDPEEPAEG